MIFWGLILFAYLLGSIPTAIIVSKFTKQIDIREHGDQNPGATNTFRVLGMKKAIFVLSIDMLKGIVAVFLPLFFDLGPEQFYSILLFQFVLGIVAIFGHQFSVFAKFRGGMGVATLIGVAIALKPLLVLSFGLVFLLLFFFLESSND